MPSAASAGRRGPRSRASASRSCSSSRSSCRGSSGRSSASSPRPCSTTRWVCKQLADMHQRWDAIQLLGIRFGPAWSTCSTARLLPIFSRPGSWPCWWSWSWPSSAAPWTGHLDSGARSSRASSTRPFRSSTSACRNVLVNREGWAASDKRGSVNSPQFELPTLRDLPGRHRVHPHATPRPLERRRLREAHHARARRPPSAPSRPCSPRSRRRRSRSRHRGRPSTACSTRALRGSHR